MGYLASGFDAEPNMCVVAVPPVLAEVGENELELL